MSENTGDQTEQELEKTRQVVRDNIAAQNEQNEDAANALTSDTPDEVAGAETEEDAGWDGYTVEELQDELRHRGLAVSGNKAELVARLNEDDA